MSNKRYTEEFKVEAVKQITERGYSVFDVAQRLGVTTHSLYGWRKSTVKDHRMTLPLTARKQRSSDFTLLLGLSIFPAEAFQLIMRMFLARVFIGRRFRLVILCYPRVQSVGLNP